MSKTNKSDVSEKFEAYVCQRDFDVPYQGTTTIYTAGQSVTCLEEIKYLLSVKAPITQELMKEEQSNG